MYIDLTAQIGSQPRTFARWPSSLSDTGKTGEILKLLERAGRILDEFDRVESGIAQNARLSDTAKAQDRREAAQKGLSALVTVQKLLNHEQESLGEQQTALLKVPPYRDGDFATVMIDLELARLIREMGPSAVAHVANSESDRMAHVLMRLPSELTGIDAASRQLLISSMVGRANPYETRALSNLAEGIEAAQSGLSNAFSMLASTAQFSYADQYAVAGPLMGVLTRDIGQAERYAKAIEEGLVSPPRVSTPSSSGGEE